MLEYYLLGINAFAFALCGYDKWLAVKHKYRISENGLFLSAILGGSLGIWCGMMIFKHKTKHKKFTIGIPLIFFIEIMLAGLLMRIGK